MSRLIQVGLLTFMGSLISYFVLGLSLLSTIIGFILAFLIGISLAALVDL